MNEPPRQLARAAQPAQHGRRLELPRVSSRQWLNHEMNVLYDAIKTPDFPPERLFLPHKEHLRKHPHLAAFVRTCNL